MIKKCLTVVASVLLLSAVAGISGGLSANSQPQAGAAPACPSAMLCWGEH